MDLRLYTRLLSAVVFRQMPNYLIAFVTGRCNMNCAICCNASGNAQNCQEMTAEQWIDAVRGIKALIHLTITGGEPFLRNDLIYLVKGMVEASGVPRVSINTNGSQPDRIEKVVIGLLKNLPHTQLTIAVSLDGPPAIHDLLREKSGSAESVYNTIERLSGLRKQFPHLSLRMQTLLQRGNVAVLEKFLSETAHWPIDYHEVIFPRDISEESQKELADIYKQLTTKQLNRASPSYRGSLEWRLFHLVSREVFNCVTGKHIKTCCPAGGRLVEIYPDGTVVGCELGFLQRKSIIGHVEAMKTRIVDIVRDKQAMRFRNETSLRCICTFECAISCKVVFEPRMWLQLFRWKKI